MCDNFVCMSMKVCFGEYMSISLCSYKLMFGYMCKSVHVYECIQVGECLCVTVLVCMSVLLCSRSYSEKEATCFILVSSTT
jgi:hypothetical protein